MKTGVKHNIHTNFELLKGRGKSANLVWLPFWRNRNYILF